MIAEIGLQSVSVSALSSATTTRLDEKKSAGTELIPAIRPRNSELDVASLKDTVSKVNEAIQVVRRELHFTLDQDSGRVVIKVIDVDDGETIRQIPSEELLQLARRFSESEFEGGLLKVIA
jgi:uncharacterized FlaG/YvyC family protein